ncbi:ATP-binding protein [Haliscomenobacter sp.]|uniref:hybrid sensor histidine kinase/response regulator n=1 Tax=Haliscomenobacter sp. TaxID=2717303 RepID=UPI0035946804
MAQTLAVLIVDDDEDDFFLTSEYLNRITGQDFTISWAPSYDQALQLFSTQHFDLCFFDYLLGFRTGLDLVAVARELDLRAPIILLTGKGDTQVDVQAIRSGVADYLEKHELDSKKLERSIRYTLERSKAAEELMRAEKLAATGRFMRTLGHEIRNPLTNIDLAVGQLLLENKDPELADYLEIIERNSKRIGLLVTELLQTSNPGQLTLQAVTIHEVLEQTLEMAADRIALKNIKLVRAYQPEQEIIQVDLEKLKIALLNIIINGVEIMEAGQGELTIRVLNFPQQVGIVIRDNGPGIPREVQNRIFEPYFSNKVNGVGLGLAGALSIVQLHGGNIEVQSSEGQGATFTVWLKR